MYRSFFSIIGIYWRDYGGFRDWISSPFLHAALFVATLRGVGVLDLDWRAISVASLPTMLGFSLAAYTITFTLMGSALHRALSSAIDRKSGTPLIKIVNATFFHVVLFQTLALIFSLITKGTFFGTFLELKLALEAGNRSFSE